ncbi:hypothetical protein DL93DRAFT_2058048, partial [Clavulina sp. PMI_390]
DYRGGVLLDLLTRPQHPVTDYHTGITGLRAEHFNQPGTSSFEALRRSAAMFLADRIIVGFELWLSLTLLRLSHPTKMTRDLSTYMVFRPDQLNSPPVTLPGLVRTYLRREIRGSFMNPVEDGRAAIDLFRCCEVQWEETISQNLWPSYLPPDQYAQCFT